MKVEAYDRYIQDRHFAASFSPAEREKSSGLTLKNLGFSERPGHMIGITNAPVTMHSGRDPRSGDNIFFVSVNYPAAGIGLEEILVQTSKATDYHGADIERTTSYEDWMLPDLANDGRGGSFQENRRLHRLHLRIPGYTEFNLLNRRKWMDAIDIRTHDPFFISRDAIRFVDTRELLYGQDYLREQKRYGGRSPWGKYERKLFGWGEDPYKEEFSWQYEAAVKNNLLLLDPLTGEGYKQFLEEEPVPVRVPPPGKELAVSAAGITAHMSLGDVDEGGFYQTRDVSMQFPPDYTDRALFPLFAWRETLDGERSFLSQRAAERLLPEHMRIPGQDVVLGRVVLSYLQPDVSARLPKALPINSKGKLQEMRAGQIPLLVSQPDQVRYSLSSDKVEGLQQTIVSFAN